MNSDLRFERWLKVSIGLMRFEPFLMSLVQNLGEMDANLCEIDFDLVQKYKNGGDANMRIPAKLNSHSGQREHPDP
ncbi:hypothetical protein [Aeromonas sp. 55A]|uniref:hypothetical protein n=1 Tax=Aeromonas sp. 55A TaxID=3452720 RepID=UPI003F79E506